MKSAASQEFMTVFLVMAFAALVFWETRGEVVMTNGQISPGAFPRLAAGLMAIFAALRALLLMLRVAQPRLDEQLDLSWKTISRPMLSALAAGGYVFFFGEIPLLPLTLVFVTVLFVIFGVRPLGGLVVKALVVSGALYLLFAHILNIAA